MEQPDFWNDQPGAQKIVEEMKGLRAIIDPWQEFENDAVGARELAEMAEEAEDVAEVVAEIDGLDERLGRLEFQLMLSGEHDDKNAVVSINPGAGGIESCDWAEMLLRMYRRWAERRGFSVEILEIQGNDEGGIKSAVMAVRAAMSPAV